MPYNHVEEFIKKCPEPELYNFELEYESEDGQRMQEYRQMRTFQRYFAYKASGMGKSIKGSVYAKAVEFVEKNQKFQDIPDWDGSGSGVEQRYLSYLVREIYRTLWSWRDIPEEERGNMAHKVKKGYGDTSVAEFGLMGPDTMNSVQTVLNAAVGDLIRKKENEDLLNKKEGHVSIAYMLELCGSPECADRFIRELEAEQDLKAYVEVYHTAGNFILVPAYFNFYRAGKTNDYWDRSLILLKNKEQEESWKSSGKEIEWSKKYFIRYMNYFFLWDYADEEGNLREISQNVKKDRNDFLRKTVKLIERRSCFMVFMLKLHQQIGADSYGEMRDELFVRVDKIYRSYEEVFCRLEGYFEKNAMQKECGDLLNAAKERIQSF